MSPLTVFILVFIISSLAGLAALLRNDAKLSLVKIFSSVLNGGLLGLGIALIYYNKFEENPYFLMGVCLLAGLGGLTTVDLILRLIRAGGFTIKVGKDEVSIPDEKDKETENKKDD